MTVHGERYRRTEFTVLIPIILSLNHSIFISHTWNYYHKFQNLTPLRDNITFYIIFPYETFIKLKKLIP